MSGKKAMNNNTIPTVLCVVGARPNFMKIAPIMDAFSVSKKLRAKLIHTGQHYDADMKHAFFDQLGIPEPNVDLEVGSGSHAVQTAEVMKRFEPVIDKEKPVAILVVGDVNSTIACALVASKKGVKVIHVEAGLRSYDRDMPEEINRVLTDQISDYLFTTENLAHINLAKEGIAEDKIFFVGNVMIDTLIKQKQRAVPIEQTLQQCGYDAEIIHNGYALLTMHRPSNVDNKEKLENLLKTFVEISQRIPVLFPIHPRTKSRIESFGLNHYLQNSLQKNAILTFTPLGYHELLGAMSSATIVLTDSGGIQEETTALGVPCITLRENTERPITVEQGTNTIVGVNPEKIIAAFNDVMRTGGKAGRVPELWDGNAAIRIVKILEQQLAS